MKKHLLLFGILFSFLRFGVASESDFFKILPKNKVKNLLEFGVGESTSYFLEKYNKVISVEFVTYGYGPETFKSYLPLYHEYFNWIPIVYFSNYVGDTTFAPYKYLGSEHMHKAGSYQCATHLDYAQIDDFYLTELNAFINNLVKCHKIDAVVVHPAAYIRGDIIKLLFGKTSIILATDTSNCRTCGTKDVYGYYKIQTPEDYEEIYLSGNLNMTVWIAKKEAYAQLAQEIKNYAALIAY